MEHDRMENHDYVDAEGESTYRDHIKDKKHYATMDDVSSEMKDKFAMVVDNADAWLNLSQAAEQMHQEELANGLKEMAYETYTHAKFMKHQLKHFGVVMGEETYRKFKELENRLQYFRR